MEKSHGKQPDFRTFKVFHNTVSLIRLWKFEFLFDYVPFIILLAKLWTIPPVYIDQTCRICQYMYKNQFQHAVLRCPSTTYVRDSLYNSLINKFDVHLYVELSQLRENVFLLHFAWRIRTQYIVKQRKQETIDLPLCKILIQCITVL